MDFKFSEMKIEENPDSPKTGRTHSKTDKATPKRAKQLRCPGAPPRVVATGTHLKYHPRTNKWVGRRRFRARHTKLRDDVSTLFNDVTDFLNDRRPLSENRRLIRRRPLLALPTSPVRSRSEERRPEQLPKRNRERANSLDNQPN